MNKSYIDFLRFCLGIQTDVPASIAEINWHDLHTFAQKQSISGLLAEKVLNIDNSIMPEQWHGNKPIEDDVLEWMQDYRLLRKINALNLTATAYITKRFTQVGFSTCILKGVGNSLLYPTPSLRTSGDVDVWVMHNDLFKKLKPDSNLTDSEVLEMQDVIVEHAIAYCRTMVPNAKACYHHIDFLQVNKREVEVHYRPSWLNSPKHNRRLQVFFMRNAESCCKNKRFLEYDGKKYEFNIPTREFNIIYQLTHIYNHLTHEGIGLRHLVDLYLLLNSAPDSNNDIARYTEQIAYLGLMPIASATMWIMAELFLLDANRLVAPPNKRLGSFLLKEIIAGGNFGHYDERLLSHSSGSQLSNNIKRSLRDIRLLAYFPQEILWEPWFRWKHYLWRMRHR